MSKTLLVSAINDALLQDNVGTDSLVFLLEDGVSTLRKPVSHKVGEWKPEIPADFPFLGIEIFDLRPMNSLIFDGKFRATVNLRIYSSDQLKVSILADRAVSLFTNIPSGEQVNRWFYDFSSPQIRALSSVFLGRTQNLHDQLKDNYEEIVQVQLIYSTVPCDRDVQPVPFVPCPPAEDSGTTC